jgi:hypothetical protein
MNDTLQRRPAPAYYPWLVAFVGMFALFLSNGMTATGITIFDPPLLDEFKWPRGDFKFRDFLNFLVTASISPFIGILIDRLNPRYLLMTGCGLRRGVVVGATDADGVDVVGRPIDEQNLFATIFTALGLDPHAGYDLPGLPTFHRVENGKAPIGELLA